VDARLHGADAAQDDDPRVHLPEAHGDDVEEPDAGAGQQRLEPQREELPDDEDEHDDDEQRDDDEDDRDRTGWHGRISAPRARRSTGPAPASPRTTKMGECWSRKVRSIEPSSGGAGSM